MGTNERSALRRNWQIRVVTRMERSSLTLRGRLRHINTRRTMDHAKIHASPTQTTLESTLKAPMISLVALTFPLTTRTWNSFAQEMRSQEMSRLSCKDQ